METPVVAKTAPRLVVWKGVTVACCPWDADGESFGLVEVGRWDIDWTFCWRQRRPLAKAFWMRWFDVRKRKMNTPQSSLFLDRELRRWGRSQAEVNSADAVESVDVCCAGHGTGGRVAPRAGVSDRRRIFGLAFAIACPVRGKGRLQCRTRWGRMSTYLFSIVQEVQVRREFFESVAHIVLRYLFQNRMDIFLETIIGKGFRQMDEGCDGSEG